MKKKTKKANTKKQPRCPYCGSVAHLRPASEIYGDPNHPGKLYVCSRYPVCNSYVATYPCGISGSERTARLIGSGSLS